MIKFKDFINESIINIIDGENISRFSDEIWELLNLSYKSIGGIKGNGFADKDSLSNFKQIKFVRKNQKIVAGLIYKDKDFRKTVAVFTDGSAVAKQELINLIKDDIKRSYIEVSHSLLKFIEKNLSNEISDYIVPASKVSDILGKEVEIVSDFKYIRSIGGEKVIKMMLGSRTQYKEYSPI